MIVRWFRCQCCGEYQTLTTPLSPNGWPTAKEGSPDGQGNFSHRHASICLKKEGLP